MDLIIALFKLNKLINSKRKDSVFSKKISEFENIIADNLEISDKDACFKLYQKSNITSTYKSLKYRVEEKLINDLIHIVSDEENLNNRINATLIVEKYSLVSSALMKNFYRKEAIMLMEKALKLAVRYSYTDQILKLLPGIVNHYSYIEPNEKQMHKLLSDLDYYSEVYSAENYVKKCNAIISNLYIMNKGGLNNKQLIQIKSLVDKMISIKEKYKSNTIVLFVNDLTYFYYQSIGDHNKGLEVAIQALEESKLLKYNEIIGIYQNKLNIAISYFYLKKYNNASFWFEEAISMPTPGTRNWFFATSLYYLNLISLRSYEELFKLSADVLGNKNLIKFPYFEEQWKIREAYLHFLIRIDKIIVTPEDKKSLKPFSLSKFMNSVPFHSKDKSGQNITIIVLQILFLLTENKYGQIIDRIDALNQYTYRYLRKDETFRSNCFIKMLVLMTKADFHPVRTQSYTEDLRKKLDNSNLITDEKSTQVEIIPYDYLWELILELLASKK